LLTENVKDFRPIMLRALQAGGTMTGLLFTSSRALPRSRRNPWPLIQALHAGLSGGLPVPPLNQDWLVWSDAPGIPDECLAIVIVLDFELTRSACQEWP
jgi:hypothetical protein